MYEQSAQKQNLTQFLRIRHRKRYKKRGIWPNRSTDKVRIAQYISMMPAQEDDEVLRQWRITSWRDRVAPEGYAFPGDPRK